ncbi:hypothetical protein DENSPDRAFT_819740 [Dentipellis sp. KUC8613]|nr:hypothetical protein DENSPDRAFT_819740 [Dentipellis sp. KUC8613]
MSLRAHLLSLPNTHPLQVAIRTYSLALSLTLGPSLLSFISSPKARAKGLHGLYSILRREFGITGFSFAITAAIGGGSLLQHLCNQLEDDRILNPDTLTGPPRKWVQRLKAYLKSLDSETKTIFLHAFPALLAFALIRLRPRSVKEKSITLQMIPSSPKSSVTRRTSASLELTLLLSVRAFDAWTQKMIYRHVDHQDARNRRHKITTRLDAFAFWASSARIMWCFFYEPQRLPRSYVKWISSLANIDERLVGALRALRTGEWSYIHGTRLQPDIVATLSKDLGYPASWGTTGLLPSHGGPAATEAWKALGVSGRDGVGGLPCELVHGNLAKGSCAQNVTLRGLYAFLEALAIYIPVHLLPVLLMRPHSLLRKPEISRLLLGILRSAGFLSTFVSSIWAAVCLTRTTLIARLLPNISHDFYDGPYGCILAGCLACGNSIWVENRRRRGEMALYVMPRAIRTCLPDRWIPGGRLGAYLVESAIFTLSLTTLISAALHRPHCLRGLSRWTLEYILKGPNVGGRRPGQLSKIPESEHRSEDTKPSTY